MKISFFVVCVLPLLGSAHYNNHHRQEESDVTKHTQKSTINQGDWIRLLWNVELKDPVKALDLSFQFSKDDSMVSYFVFTDDQSLVTQDGVRLCYNGDLSRVHAKAKAKVPNGRIGAIAERNLAAGNYFLYFLNCNAEAGEVSLTWSVVQEEKDQDSWGDGRWGQEGSDSDSVGDSDDSDSHGHRWGHHHDHDSDNESESVWYGGSGWRHFLDRTEGGRRDDFFYLYAAEAGVYGLGLIMWFVNWANDRHANTKLQKFLTFVPLTRVCFALSELLVIESHRYVGTTNLPLQISGFVFEILNMLTFFVGLEYAAYGMSTKRSDISCKRKLYSYFLASAMIGTGEVSEIFGGYTFIPACVTYVVLMHNVFSCSSKCTTGFLKDVEKMRRDGRNPRNTPEMEKLDTMVLFRFFLTLFTVLDIGSWAITHFAIHENVMFAQQTCEGAKQLFFMIVFGTIFRVKSYNKVVSGRRKRRSKHKKRMRFGRKGRQQRMDSQMSYRDVDYVGMDDLPPVSGGNDVMVNMESSPNALVVPQHLQGQHRQQYPPWKCEKCTALNDGPMTHCSVCEVWNCRTCTMDNPMHSEICVACDQKRPEPDAIEQQKERHADNMRPEFWECDKCSFQNALENEFCEECESWSCLACTMKNRLGLPTCGVCGKDRPSDLQMKMHRELEAKRRALEEAQQQNAALNKRLMERQQQEQNYYPRQAFMAREEVSRGIEDVGVFQAAPQPVTDDIAQECVEMDNLKRDAEPKVELRSVVSDGAIIVYDTPSGPPEMSELIKKPEETHVTPEEPATFDVFRERQMESSIVSDSVPIHFDDAPAVAQEAPKVTIIQVEDETFFPQDNTQFADDTASETTEDTQEQAVEDMLHLNEEAPASETEAPKEETIEQEVVQEEQAAGELFDVEEQEVNEQDDVSETGTTSYYTGTDLLQFLMDANASKVLSDENLEKLMLQIRENAHDKQTLLESLDACQGDVREFFRMCSLMGFI